MSKKPYSSPKLTVHGDVKDLTQAVGNKGAKDGVVQGFEKRTQ